MCLRILHIERLGLWRGESSSMKLTSPYWLTALEHPSRTSTEGLWPSPECRSIISTVRSRSIFAIQEILLTSCLGRLLPISAPSSYPFAVPPEIQFTQCKTANIFQLAVLHFQKPATASRPIVSGDGACDTHLRAPRHSAVQLTARTVSEGSSPNMAL